MSEREKIKAMHEKLDRIYAVLDKLRKAKNGVDTARPE